uniref:Uncharacterized protein n=1 Tax=Anguilla anguilla TaxID=7936 RepID=A0A0E9S2C5_ANGAN
MRTSSDLYKILAHYENWRKTLNAWLVIPASGVFSCFCYARKISSYHEERLTSLHSGQR